MNTSCFSIATLSTINKNTVFPLSLQVPLPGGVAEGVIHYCIADLESPSPSPYSGTSLLSAAVAPLGELQGEQERQWRLFDRRTGVIAIARGWASPAFVQDLDTALQARAVD